MRSTKVNLSAKELQMVQSEDIILTRIAIMQKVKVLLSERIPQIETAISAHLPAEIQSEIIHPKISKGENYLQLPYMILDCPRIFNENVFAVRTMFWWSKFFSVTLQLSGKYLDHFREKLIENYPLIPANYFLCINEDQWQHHFENDNFISIQQVNETQWQTIVRSALFIKLSVKFDLKDWEQMSELLDESYEQSGSLLR